jgi:glycosyltransferase involved in cell wall biosynthesis
VTHEEGRPAVSVIIPLFNRADSVEGAVRSVLAQEFSDFERIVVDDGSSDRSADIVEANADPRVRLVRQPRNLGGNAARNRGIELARAPLLTFLDSDDYYLPHKLSVVTRTFAERPEIGLLIDSYAKKYLPEGKRRDVECRNPRLETNAAVLEALFTRRIWKATPGISVRRDAAIAAGIFTPALKRRQDFDFILRVAAVARCATIDEVLWVKTYSTETISADPGNFVASMLQFHALHPEYYDNPAYRPGFAHDVGRHFVRLMRKGRVGAALRDASACIDALGSRRFATLLVEGTWRFRERRKRLRASA